MTTDLWTLERRLWTEGPAAFSELMDMQAVMVFPQPIGILYDGDILSEVDAAPRWDECEMSGRVDRRRDAVIILNYLADARRNDGASYSAMCTSVWQEVDTGYRIVAHQQTPTDATIDYPGIDRSKLQQRLDGGTDTNRAASDTETSGA